MGLARRAAIADRLNPPKRVRRGRGGRRFHHRGTESTKICRGEEGLLSGCPRLIAFGDSASIRGNCLRMDVLQREEPRKRPNHRGACPWVPQKKPPCSLCLCGEFPLEMKMATFIEARFPGLSGGNLDWQRVSWSYGQDTICAKCDPLRSNDLPGELSLVLYVRS